MEDASIVSFEEFLRKSLNKLRLEKGKIPESLKGYFLISEFQILDPNFIQSVILILEHNDEGAFGLTVNRRSKLILSDVFSHFSDEPQARKTPLYVGGPLQQDYLFTLHSEMTEDHQKSETSSDVGGVIFEPSFQAVSHYFQDSLLDSIPPDDRPTIRFFLGYSGWGKGQLEDELESGSWVVLQATPEIVFHPSPDECWRKALEKKDRIYKVFVDSHQDPSLN